MSMNTFLGREFRQIVTFSNLSSKLNTVDILKRLFFSVFKNLFKIGKHFSKIDKKKKLKIFTIYQQHFSTYYKKLQTKLII